jgi:hypothetical protein
MNIAERSFSPTEVRYEASQKYHREFYWWHVRKFRCEPEEGVSRSAYRQAAFPNEDSSDDGWLLLIFGWLLQRYLVLMGMTALLYLLRFGEEGTRADLRKLERGREFLLAVLFWPAMLLRYPHDYIKEWKVAVAQRRYEQRLWRPLDQEERLEIRTIAASKERYAAWKKEYQERKKHERPRWQLAAAVLAVTVAFLLPGSASAKPTSLSPPVMAVQASARGPDRSLLTICQQASSRTQQFWAQTEHPALLASPASDQLVLVAVIAFRKYFRETVCRIRSGWRRVPDHIPICSLYQLVR